MPKPSVKPQADLLVDYLTKYSDDPLGFVETAFTWGESELVDYDGPDTWQRDVLTQIRDRLRAGLIGTTEAIQIAVASGHGPGKSALVAWIILWAISTFPDTRGVVTANTDTQLRTKTWPEVAKWHRLSLVANLFELTATSIYSRQAGREKTWRIDIIPWSENNTEAFAGLHNQGKRIILLFDEASAIPSIIWETAEGALTDKNTQIIWCVFGNPTRNTGRFREAFGRLKHRWWTKQVDSRTAKMTDKEQIAKWITDYGEDSDFVRVRVKGVFPRVGAMQFIANDVVEAAKTREAKASIYDPLIMGVEVARFGDDKSVIRFRKGRAARTHPPLKYRGLDTMQLAARVAEQYNAMRPDAVFVDGGGVGGGVVDRLRQLRVPVIEVQFGGAPDRMAGQVVGEDDVVYANKSAEMWGSMREWLKTGAIDDDPDLETDLTGREYGFVLREGRDAIILEKKKDMKKRGLASPDDADGLCLTFAYPVQPNPNAGRAAAGAVATQPGDDYDPFNPPRTGRGVKSDYDPFA